MKRLGTLDLLILVLILSVPLAEWRVRVDGAEHWLLALLVVWPAAFTALVHLRFRLSLRTAIAILYPLSIAFAFADGVVASITWNRIPHGFFDAWIL